MGPDVAAARFLNAPQITVRLEAHNASVDETSLQVGACARIHLPTGRICTMRHGHKRSCEFVTPDQVAVSLARHQSVEGW